MSSEAPAKEIKRTDNVAEIELAAEPYKRPFREAVLLEELRDGLQIPAPWQVDRVFVPPEERLFLGDIGWVVDMLEIDRCRLSGNAGRGACSSIRRALICLGAAHLSPDPDRKRSGPRERCA
jgi:hypothetical protein